MKNKIILSVVVLASVFALTNLLVGTNNVKKVAAADLIDGQLTDMQCHPKMSLIKLTGTGTPGRQIDVYLDNPKSASSPYLIQCGKKADIYDKDSKTIGQDTVGSDGKFECYLDPTDYNQTVLAGHKLYIYTYDTQTHYSYILQGNINGQVAPNCAKWSTNFVCNGVDNNGTYTQLTHSLVINCAGKEIYNNPSRVGNINEQILMPEGENCEATCKSADSNYKMYGYYIGNAIAQLTDDKLTKSTNETITFKMDKTKPVYRWLFKTEAASTCIAENQTIATGQTCCSGLVAKDGKCVKPEVAVDSFKLTMGLVQSIDEAKDFVRLRMGAKASVECDGGFKQDVDFSDGTVIQTPIGAAGKNCKIKLASFNDAAHFSFYGYTNSKNLADSEIETYHRAQTIVKNDTLTITPAKDDLIQIRWYLKAIDVAGCLKENETGVNSDNCCSGLVAKYDAQPIGQTTGSFPYKCVKLDTTNCLKENETEIANSSSQTHCCSGLTAQASDVIRSWTGGYSYKCTSSDTSKVNFQLIGNVRDSGSKEKIADVGSNVKMTIECSDGKIRNLNTKDGYYIYNINNLPVSGCKLINNTEALIRNNWSVADYKYKGYTLCADNEIGSSTASCATNVISKNSWDMSSIKSGSKYQIVYLYDKLNVENKPANSDLSAKIDQLITMIKKILEKLGISL